ncbi:MAG: nucleotide exchange factor GrpE [Chloroflexota bacterium]|nr:nucleotide exchange factor GrpE [Chloroflexota bacterium]
MADNETREKEAQVAEEEKEVVEQADAAGPTEAVAEAEAVEEAEAEELSEVEELQEELEEARAQAEEYLDGWRRAQAEFSNYKKRQRAEQAKMQELANAGLLRKLLPILDDLDRAFVTMPEGIQKLSWSQGLLMIRRKLEAILESEGVEPIETQGETFDPYYHEAVTHEEAEGYEEGEIIGEVQKGYVLGDRVLRPALVRVAKAVPVSPEEEGEGEEGEMSDG